MQRESEPSGLNGGTGGVIIGRLSWVADSTWGRRFEKTSRDGGVKRRPLGVAGPRRGTLGGFARLRVRKINECYELEEICEFCEGFQERHLGCCC